MKVWLLGIAVAVIAFSQTKGTTEQQAKDCAQNFIGNNNTGTVTCYNVDKKLADQIGQLVAASKRDGKTLKDISDKLDVLLQAQPSVTTTIQQAPNGINIGPGAIAPNPQVNNFGPPEPKLTWSQEQSTDDKGKPLVKIVLSVDRSMEIGAFGAICERPCKTVDFTPLLPTVLSGNERTLTATDQRFAGIVIGWPRPLGAGVRIQWRIRADDGDALQIQIVGNSALNNCQRTPSTRDTDLTHCRSLQPQK